MQSVVLSTENEKGERKMHKRSALLGIILAAGGSVAMAQQVQPSYKADPSVYKLIYEDANFRVIEGVRPKGVHDKVHSHPSPGVVYNLTDCATKIYLPDGKTREAKRKAGEATSVPITPSHSAENTGSSDCKQIFVEKK
jgi:hypothetical protein